MPSSATARAPIASYACLAASMALVGSYVGASKLLVVVFPVFLLAWLRFGIGAVAMWRWTKRPPDETPLTPATRRLLFLESFLGNFLFSICMLYGMSMASAVAAGVVMACIPAAVALLSWAFLRERLSARLLVAIALAVGGVASLSWVSAPQGASTGGASVSNASPWGIALLLGAVFCEASYAVIGKRLSGVMGPKRISAIVNLWGFVLVTPLGLWMALSFDFSAVAAPTWGLLVLYSLAASVWTVWLWMTGLKGVPAAQAGLFTVFLPLAATAVGVVFLGEVFTSGHALALGLALGGVVLASWPTQSSKP
jgi:drug/metabolite transporter (DMT)-like permease